MKMMKIFSAAAAALLVVSSPMAITAVYAYDPYEAPYKTTKPVQKRSKAVKKTSKKVKKKTTTPKKSSRSKTKAAAKQKVSQVPRLMNWNFRNMTVTLQEKGAAKTLYLEQLSDDGIRLNNNVPENTTFVVPKGYIAHCDPAKHESLNKPGTLDRNQEGYPFIIFSSGTTVKCNNGEGPVVTLFRSY